MKVYDRCLLPILILFLFNACGKTTMHQENVLHDVAETKGKNEVLLHYTKQEDLPVPLGFMPIPDRFYVFADKTIAWYKGALLVEQCISFYKQSMEVYGWKVEDFSLAYEGFLVCKKAQKRAVIVIRRVMRHRTEVGIILRYSNDQEEHVETVDQINSKKLVY